MKTRFLTFALGLISLAAGVAVLWPSSHTAEGRQEAAKAKAAEAAAPKAPERPVERVEIPAQATFSVLMQDSGVSGADAAAIYAAAKDIYDLAAIRAGKSIDLYRERPGGPYVELVYALNDEEELHVRRQGAAWVAAKETIAYEIRQKTVEGTIDSSLYAAAMAQGVDERAVIAMADVFQWTIDFAQDVRVGDTFKLIYEERYRDGKYVMPGHVLAAEYVNDGTAYRGYRFVDSKGEEGYYDEKGMSLRKMFLKAPVAFKYITSGFTTGLRYVSAFNTSTGHRAIDYAAKAGTPIRATADGVVSFAGWGGPYGNKVTIRHNATYSTNYCHQSKMIVKKGQKVSQGQVIGYVGSTGFSTGPHLHYEMVKNGTKINPLKETFPGTDPVPDAEKPAFEEVVRQWQDKL
ncbi:MAG TPA: peptidoglycan DD-metalloendopeptidase family protein [Patescibacteria group bacterium]|nr:peptidoglycan DD-metalloendopeptidase family protein [Patescibacteria group bacterium]